MYKTIHSAEQLDKIQAVLLQTNPIISFDTETEGLSPKFDKVAGFSISYEKGKAFYIPVFHKTGTNVPFERAKAFLEAIKNLRIVMHNALFDKAMVICTFGVNLRVFADTMGMASLLSEPKGLKDLSKKYMSAEQKHFETLMKEKFGASWAKNGKNMTYISADDPELSSYACDDADYTLQLFWILLPKVASMRNIVKIENALTPIVTKLNLTGMLVDIPKLQAAIIDYKEAVDQNYREIMIAANRTIALNSPKQLAEYLFGPVSEGNLGLPVLERSKKTGAPSTSKEVLEELAEMNPIVKKILMWRCDSRMLTSTLEKITAGVDENNRIVTRFDNYGAVSGRFTSSGEEDHNGIKRGLNLQNVSKAKDGRKIDMRSAFIAPEGYTFVKCDYSQIEYRVQACLSQDQYMIDSFNKGVDAHTFTAHIMLDKPVADISKDERALGKTMNFGLSYGMSAKGLSAKLGCTEDEAATKMEYYFSRMPSLVAYINQVKMMALQNHYTTTFFGRRRLFDFDNIPKAQHDKLLRMSYNTSIQGTAADLLKIAMLRVAYNVLKKWGRAIEYVATVHDEMDFYVRNDVLQEVLLDIKTAMTIPTPDNWCEIKADITYGRSWSEDEQEEFVAPEGWRPEPFTGWGNVLPKEVPASFLDDIDCKNYIEVTSCNTL